MDGLSQSPSAPILINSPFEEGLNLYTGIQRGWGNGSISDLNHLGIIGIADFSRYKLQVAVGRTENENFKNTLSFNSGISFSFRKSPFSYLFQPAMYSGFGYTKVYTSLTDSYDMINIPFGITLGFDGPTPIADLDISISPKIQYRYMNIDDGKNHIGYGVKFGLSYAMPGTYLGFKIGADFLSIKRGLLTQNEVERSLLIGIEYLIYE